jgi:hypothetical protein
LFIPTSPFLSSSTIFRQRHLFQFIFTPVVPFVPSIPFCSSISFCSSGNRFRQCHCSSSPHIR